MIYVRDASTLALTKLRTRKVRLFVTVFISGLLFSALAGLSIFMRGAFKSVDNFSKEGFGDRYILQAGILNGTDVGSLQEVRDRAAAIQKDIVARKKAEAKRLGIDYDATTEAPVIQSFDSPGGKQQFLDFTQPAAIAAFEEYAKAHPSAGLSDLKKMGDAYGATAYYESQNLMIGQPTSPTVKVIKDGKEPYDAVVNNQNGPPTGLDSLTSSWALMSDELLKPFLLPGATTTQGADGSLPIVAPYSAVEQLLKLKELPSNATPADRLARIKEIRNKAKNLTFQVCVRNNRSSDLLNKAVASQTELDQNKNNKNYQKPDLIYGLPSTPCAAISPSRDVRSPEQKDLDAKQQQFAELFGQAAPQQTLLTFRVIGIAPDPYGVGVSGIGQLLAGLVGSSLGQGGWYTPLKIGHENPVLADMFKPSVLQQATPSGYFVEFPSATTAKKFMDEKNCSPDFGALPPPGVNVGAVSGPFDNCSKEGKPFSIFPFGSNSLALDSARKGFSKFFRIAVLVVAIIASIIMMGTIGRTIADSRRETAVFRAIGAKKLDIASVYVIYTICISLLIALFAIVVGSLLAQIANAHWQQDATVQALVIYNAQDLTRTFTFFQWYGRDMLYLIGLAVAGGLVSMTLPLLRNLRRNPIRDMRDEN